MNINLTHQYADLGKSFSLPALPATVPNPQILLWNEDLAAALDINLSKTDRALFFSGQKTFKGSQPVAMAYSGHQFGQFNPHLGDGRAHLLGEIKDLKGQQFDVHLKGSGRTPFSKNGDGKCGIQPAVREFIMSESMHALGVPTTRSLAVVTTGEPVIRQTRTTGAVVTRIATSHLRIGTFEHFAARNQPESVKKLADLALAKHFPQIDNNDDDTKYLNLLSHVIDKQIKLVVNWMRVGFIHGVMNTDNSLLSGETIDYGPCAMLGVYDPHTVFSSIDHQGRYAWGNQPWITQWNLARLAECLLPLIHSDQKQAISLVTPLIEGFGEKYNEAFSCMMAAKIGFNTDHQPPVELINELLALMQNKQLDYTQTFVTLTAFTSSDTEKIQDADIQPWIDQWMSLLQQKQIELCQAGQLMQTSNPLVIPRNHHVERVLAATEANMNSDAVNQFLEVMRNPYQQQPNTAIYQDTDPDADLNYQTFCGT